MLRLLGAIQERELNIGLMYIIKQNNKMEGISEETINKAKELFALTSEEVSGKADEAVIAKSDDNDEDDEKEEIDKMKKSLDKQQ